jgi:hypothetical protein
MVMLMMTKRILDLWRTTAMRTRTVAANANAIPVAIPAAAAVAAAVTAAATPCAE